MLSRQHPEVFGQQLFYFFFTEWMFAFFQYSFSKICKESFAELHCSPVYDKLLLIHFS